MYLDGINFDLFNRERVDPSPLYGKYPSLRHGPVLLFVGRITPSRNLEMLIDAMVIVTRMFPKAVLVITGKESDAAYSRGLHDRVSREGLQASILFTGVADWDDLARLYKACDIFVTPSLWEGFLRAEAFAMGKPMVAFDVAANPDTIRDGENGLLVKGHTVGDLADALLRLLHNPATADAMGEAGYRWARENLNFDDIARRLVVMLEERVRTR
jgi:phosphatidylinositol alpha-1,6-mannosyltransferase